MKVNKIILIFCLFMTFIKGIGQTGFKDSLRTQLGIYFGTVENPDDLQNTAPRPANFISTYINPYVNTVLVPAGWRRVENSAQNVFTWGAMDSICDLAVAQGYKLRIHSLAWNSDIPLWLANGTWTSAQKQAILINHIDSVVLHFKTKYPSTAISYTVVNEPLCKPNDIAAGICYSSGLKNSFWSDVHYASSTDSTDWIKMAFVEARAADATAKLYLSDISTERGGSKPEQQYALVTHLISGSTPINGVAYESHVPGIDFSTPPEKLTAEFGRYTALGLNVQVSEFECRLPPDWRSYSDSALAQQSKVFKMILDAYAHANTVNRDMFNLWGLWDSTQNGGSDRKGSILANDFSQKPNYKGLQYYLAHYSKTAPLIYPLYLSWTRFDGSYLNNDGTWPIDKSGDTYQSFTFPTTSSYKIVISAYGIPLNSVYPSLQVKIDGTPMDTLIIASQYMRDYAITHSLTSGSHTIAFNLINPQSLLRVAVLKEVNIGSPGSIPNIGPVVIIAVPASLALSTVLSLDGSLSYDGDNVGISSYSWIQTGGTSVAILNPTTSLARVVFSQVGTYTFSLTVTDTQGASTTLSRTITVTSSASCNCQN